MPQSRLLSPGGGSNSILSPESLELTRDANAAAAAAAAGGPTSPTPRIRVRQDLMQHLGLVARSSANIVQTDRGGGGQRLTAQQQQQQQQQQLLQISSGGGAVTSLTLSVAKAPQAAATAVPPAPTPVSATPNLAKLLSESAANHHSSLDLSAGGSAAASVLSTGHRSSNSQLFKSSESSSGAIPLTFNNSIAEVLAAAASKAKLNVSREPSPKPEVTITAKSSAVAAGRQFSTMGGGTTKFSVLKQQGKMTAGLGGTSGGSVTVTPTHSGGANYGNSSLSILKRPMSGVESGGGGVGGVNPISNMTKLLQAQAPGLPPHIIAQQALPNRTSPKVWLLYFLRLHSHVVPLGKPTEIR